MGLALLICLSVALILFLIGYAVSRIRSYPKLYISSNADPKLLEVVNSVKAINEGFRPVPWLWNTHAQTIATSMVRRTLDPPYRRELYQLEDGGQVALDWLTTADSLDPSAPVLLLLHGLTGGSQESYIQHFMYEVLAAVECRPVVMVNRGLGGVELKTWTPYNAGRTDDIRAVVPEIRRRFPDAPIIAAGFSLGANILACYLGQEKENCLISAAVCVSCPFNLRTSSDFIESSVVGRMYSSHMTKGLLRFTRTNEAMLRTCPHNVDFEKIYRSKCLKDYDENGTAKIFGLSCANEYYRKYSSMQFLSGIAVPTMFISSTDDPVCGDKVVAEAGNTLFENPFAVVVASSRGGHVGFLEARDGNVLKWLQASDSWSDRAGAEFFANCLRVFN